MALQLRGGRGPTVPRATQRCQTAGKGAAGAKAGVKAPRSAADEECMRIKELSCPVCSADFPLAGDEKPGEEVFCTYCGAPCRLKGTPTSEDCSV